MSYIKILGAIGTKLKDKFGLPILSSSDVEEKILRPSFMVDLDNLGNNDLQGISQNKKMTVMIYYFSATKDKNKIENFNMMDSLNELFVESSVIEIEDGFSLDIDSDIEMGTVDKVLQYQFDIEYNEIYDRVDDTELMEELEIKNI